VAQLILNKDEKCIRQEILKFLRRRNRCWSKAIWKMQMHLMWLSPFLNSLILLSLESWCVLLWYISSKNVLRVYFAVYIRNRCWSKAIWKMQWIMRFTVSVQHVQVLFYLQKEMPMSRKPEVWHPRISKIVIWAVVHGERGLLRSPSKLIYKV
jgi:hypothetical protein